MSVATVAVGKHRGRKSRRKPVKLRCDHCGYVWDYYGKLDRYGTNCPRCMSWVTIPANLRRIPPKSRRRPRQPSKPGIRLKCPKCGHEWTYAGQHITRIMSGISVRISCPACGAKVRAP